MANSSVFPSQIDSFKTFSEIPQSQRANLATYQSLLQQSTLTPDQQAQLTQLTETLSPFLVDSQDLQLITDSITNIEQFFLQNVNSYFDNFKFLGTWSQSTSYQEWNTVTFNGQSYLSLQSPNLGNEPDTSSTYWALVAKQGSVGPQGPAGAALTYVGTYNSLSTYQQNQLVSYNGSTYICLQNNTTGYDPTNTTYWTLFVTGATPQAQSTAPTNPVANQLWIDTTTAGDPLLKYWNSSSSTWVVVSPDQPVSNATTTSVGLVEISSAPSGGNPVAVTTTDGAYAAIHNGTYITQGTGISVTNGTNGQTVTNTGVTSFNGSTGAITGVSSVNGQTGAVTVQGYNPLTSLMAWVG